MTSRASLAICTSEGISSSPCNIDTDHEAAFSLHARQHDPQVIVGRVSPVFEEEEPEDRPPEESRDVQDARGGGAPRTRCSVLQTRINKKGRGRFPDRALTDSDF